MVIIKICEGLGNQFFQYALYRSLQEMGKDVSLDISWYDRNSRKSNRKFLLDIYNTKLEFCNQVYRKKLANADYNIFCKITQKIVGKKLTHYKEKSPSIFDEDIFLLDNVYLDGYWQSEKYFAHIGNIIRNELTLECGLDNKNQKLKLYIESTNSIGVHIRRGDYLKHTSMYGNICNEEYYSRAIEYVLEHIDNPCFFAFSDDVDWSTNFFSKYKNVELVDINGQEKSFYDLYLMSLCKHNIIANSSFSWWASWLNKNPNKFAIAPGKWLNNFNATDIECSYWIRM